MTIDQSTAEGVLTLKVSGLIDLSASPKLREDLHEIADTKPAAVVIDLSEVSYIDSSGLATLIEFYRELKAENGRLALCSLQPRVRTVFDLVRLNELFQISDTAAAATAAVLAPKK